ncbi:flavin reductase family protein [Arthrobacter sp. Cr_A7]|jgi:flavin reductase (DIM6/NTAB) family NADH-FMN oxidoreductase RutF|uniref:flavin reductase family protein n=1 Tax=Arthrobacter sp. Cr_A7 TaxID=3031017 RepID=UPI0023DB8B63|nr:flavin reductase family protein [Arthrobacter sp. Cr_A7]MDF2051911.1 flavin reductase family protein [Arthrobacter sp. Cr_A7]
MDITPATEKTPDTDITPAFYRQVLGKLPTGVTAITGVNDDKEKLGLVVGTFQSLSLEPPLVMFCVDKSSSSWPKLRKLKNFTANILADDQIPICRSLSRKGPEKFEGLPSTDGPLGTPHLDGAIAYIDCVVTAEIVVGDHYMVVGAVTHMAEGSGDALLFRGGKFGQYQPIEIPTEAARSAS